jgi:hypothetical protein
VTDESNAPRTRRALLAAALGAVGATVAGALGRPQVAEAASYVALGATNSTGSATLINTLGALGLEVTSDTHVGLVGQSQSSFGMSGLSSSSFGVIGTSSTSDGVYGEGHHAIGVHGASRYGIGVEGEGFTVGVLGKSYATTGEYYGVFGQVVSPSGRAVFGWSTDATAGTGVFGQVNGPHGVGTRGLAWNPSLGTTGLSYGTGVIGSSGPTVPVGPGNTGVYGQAAVDSLSVGVHGHSDIGIALVGTTTTPKTGIALQAVGRVRFDNSVGIATIAAGKNSVVVTPGIDLQATAAVVATLQGNPGGTVVVKSVAVNAAADTFTIYLTCNAAAAVQVAWHVFG